MAIGFFAFVEAIDHIPISLWNLPLRSFLSVCILGVFLVLGIYMLSRLHYYGTLAGDIPHISVIDSKTVKEKDLNNPVDLLNYVCIVNYEKKNKKLRYLAGIGFIETISMKVKLLIYGGIWSIPVISYLIINLFFPNIFT